MNKKNKNNKGNAVAVVAVSLAVGAIAAYLISQNRNNAKDKTTKKGRK